MKQRTSSTSSKDDKSGFGNLGNRMSSKWSDRRRRADPPRNGDKSSISPPVTKASVLVLSAQRMVLAPPPRPIPIANLEETGAGYTSTIVVF